MNQRDFSFEEQSPSSGQKKELQSQTLHTLPVRSKHDTTQI